MKSKITKAIISALLVVLMFAQNVTMAFAQGESIYVQDETITIGLSKEKPERLLTYGVENWDTTKSFASTWTGDGWREIKGNKLTAATKITQNTDFINILCEDIDSVSGAYIWAGYPTIFTFPTGDFTAEITARLAGETDQSSNKIAMRFDNKKGIELLLFTNSSGGYVTLVGGSEKYDIDTTQWHDYRFVVEDDRSYSFYVDGVKVFTEVTPINVATGGADLMKFGAETNGKCNMDIIEFKITDEKLIPPPIRGLSKVTLSHSDQEEGSSTDLIIEVLSDVVDDGTTVTAELVDSLLAPVSGVFATATMLDNKAAVTLNIPPTVVEGSYFVKITVEELEMISSGYNIYEKLGDKPILPTFTPEGPIIALEDYIYNPTDEFNFPAVIDTSLHPVANSLGRYYMFYAPHDAPAGLCLAASDSLDGPWTEYGANPIIERNWAGNHSVSHISSPHVIWNDIDECYYMYYHGENTTTRYATSDDLVNWTYGGVCVVANDFSPTGSGHSEASYARVVEHTIPGLNNKYIMTIMINNTANMRKIFYAYSDDGKSWTANKTPLLSPDNTKAPDGIDY